MHILFSQWKLLHCISNNQTTNFWISNFCVSKANKNKATLLKLNSSIMNMIYRYFGARLVLPLLTVYNYSLALKCPYVCCVTLVTSATDIDTHNCTLYRWIVTEGILLGCLGFSFNIHVLQLRTTMSIAYKHSVFLCCMDLLGYLFYFCMKIYFCINSETCLFMFGWMCSYFPFQFYNLDLCTYLKCSEIINKCTCYDYIKVLLAFCI